MRVSTEISKEDKLKLQKYWNIVIGEPIFKTREILQAEREAVLTLRLQQEREKKRSRLYTINIIIIIQMENIY